MQLTYDDTKELSISSELVDTNTDRADMNGSVCCTAAEMVHTLPVPVLLPAANDNLALPETEVQLPISLSEAESLVLEAKMERQWCVPTTQHMLFDK